MSDVAATYRSLLVPISLCHLRGRSRLTPDSRIAFGLAMRLAAALRARITLVHVLSPVGPDDSSVVDESKDGGLPAARTAMDQLASSSRAGGVPSEWEFLFGVPWEEITSRANAGEHDLVVIGTRQHFGQGGAMMSRIVERVIRTCSISVLVARNNRAAARCVVVGTDLSRSGDEVVRRALDIARWRRGRLVVVHAAPGVERLAVRRAELELQMARVLYDREVPLEIETEVVSCQPGHAIWNRARVENAEIVVMGMVGRQGVDRMLRANTAEELAPELHCCLLTVPTV